MRGFGRSTGYRGVQTSAPSTAFATFVAGLGADTYAQYTPATPFTQAMALWGGGGICSYSTKGVYDPVYRCFNFWGGPHSTKDPRHLRFNENGDLCEQESVNQPYNGLGSGTTIHGYQHIALNPATGDQFHCRINGSQVYRLPGASRDNPATWASITGGHGGGGAFSNAIEWFPERNRLIWIGSGTGGVWEYNVASNTWAQLRTAAQVPGLGGAGGLGVWACYVPSQQAVYFGGGVGSAVMYRLASDGTVTSRADSPINLSTEYEGTVGPDFSGGATLIAYGNAAVNNNNEYRYTEGSNSWAANGTHSMAVTPNFEYVLAPCAAYNANVFLRIAGNGDPEIWVHRP